MFICAVTFEGTWRIIYNKMAYNVLNNSLNCLCQQSESNTRNWAVCYKGLDEYSSDKELAAVALFQDYPEALLNFAVACCFIFMIIGIPGNIITILALSKYKKVSKTNKILIERVCTQCRWIKEVGQLCSSQCFSLSILCQQSWQTKNKNREISQSGQNITTSMNKLKSIEIGNDCTNWSKGRQSDKIGKGYTDHSVLANVS